MTDEVLLPVLSDLKVTGLTYISQGIIMYMITYGMMVMVVVLEMMVLLRNQM